MKYSAIRKNKWTWTYDIHGSSGYNILGAFECTLINLHLITKTSDWIMDEMERYSYKFCGENNFMPPPNSSGFIEIDDDFNAWYHLNK